MDALLNGKRGAGNNPWVNHWEDRQKSRRQKNISLKWLRQWEREMESKLLWGPERESTELIMLEQSYLNINNNLPEKLRTIFIFKYSLFYTFR